MWHQTRGGRGAAAAPWRRDADAVVSRRSRGGETTMKVLVVGAGAQGHVVTWNLARCPEVTEIVLGDIDEERAAAVAAWVGGSKTRAVALDASSVAAIEKTAAGAKLVMNATVPEF